MGQAPWAPCLGEGSFSALILPCWGDLCKKTDEPRAVRSTAKRSPPNAPATYPPAFSTLLSCGIHRIGQQWLCPRNSSWRLRETGHSLSHPSRGFCWGRGGWGEDICMPYPALHLVFLRLSLREWSTPALESRALVKTVG